MRLGLLVRQWCEPKGQRYIVIDEGEDFRPRSFTSWICLETPFEGEKEHPFCD
jgi:hypothetical protein